jgi:hypothetical protein
LNTGAAPELEPDEARGRGEADRARDEHRPACPAHVGALDEREHDAGQPKDRQSGAQQVERRRSLPRRLRQQRVPGRHRDERERHVDEEHRLPAEGRHEDAAHHRPQAHPDARERRPDRQRARAFLGREHHRQQRQRRWQHARRARPHEGPRADELAGRPRERREDRGRGERREAAEEHEAASEAVGEAAADEQEARERHEEPVDDPLQLADAGPQVIRDRRKRDVDRRHVHRADEHRHADHQQPLPPPLMRDRREPEDVRRVLDATIRPGPAEGGKSGRGGERCRADTPPLR